MDHQANIKLDSRFVIRISGVDNGLKYFLKKYILTFNKSALPHGICLGRSEDLKK